jgi:hypothetical protein
MKKSDSERRLPTVQQHLTDLRELIISLHLKGKKREQIMELLDALEVR